LLGPAIDALLRGAGWRPDELAAIVAGLGPGPFTGLRVGLVTALSMAHALDIPTYGVCSLDALGQLAGARMLVATDARRREVYWAVYDGTGTRVIGPAVDRPGSFAEQLDGVVEAIGDGAIRYAAELGLPVRPEPQFPPAAHLLALAADRVRSGAPAEPLTPLYLRRPDAQAPGVRKSALPPEAARSALPPEAARSEAARPGG
jgi:tRNA threonylcarbamoyl adenosine modification protein YeaZ